MSISLDCIRCHTKLNEFQRKWCSVRCRRLSKRSEDEKKKRHKDDMDVLESRKKNMKQINKARIEMAVFYTEQLRRSKRAVDDFEKYRKKINSLV